jgi:hypothetical protein
VETGREMCIPDHWHLRDGSFKTEFICDKATEQWHY